MTAPQLEGATLTCVERYAFAGQFISHVCGRPAKGMRVWGNDLDDEPVCGIHARSLRTFGWTVLPLAAAPSRPVEREEARRAVSQRLFGHTGASITDATIDAELARPVEREG